MRLIRHKGDLLEQLTEWRHRDERVAVVPTMGNLHAGHLSLVHLAQKNAERVVVTLFVNPTQFGDGEDFEAYPRSLKRDTRCLEETRADVLFVPDTETIYPFGIENATRVSVPGLTEIFCGSRRPGHFDGVTSVVMRLFSIVQPDVAVFGQKDYQQQLIIRRMAEDLSLPIQIIVGPTLRESDGLAMSSRNSYLNVDERRIAPILYQVLRKIAENLRAGERNFNRLEDRATRSLAESSFRPEYFAVRQALNLREPDLNCNAFVVLAAVRLGTARLIDNIVLGGNLNSNELDG